MLYDKDLYYERRINFQRGNKYPIDHKRYILMILQKRCICGEVLMLSLSIIHVLGVIMWELEYFRYMFEKRMGNQFGIRVKHYLFRSLLISNRCIIYDSNVVSLFIGKLERSAREMQTWY